MNRVAVALTSLLLLAAGSGCLESLFGKEGCPAVLMGNPSQARALLRICDYAFELQDDEDAIVVKALGVAPDSWHAVHLSWRDLAIEPRNATLRVAFQARANLTTGWDVPMGEPQSLGPLNPNSIDLEEYVTLCESAPGEHEVRFWFFQKSKGRWDDAGGVIEIVWTDIRDC